RRIIDRENAKCRVEDVARHITEGACSEREPTTPVEWMVGRIVVSFFSWTEPEIPVEFLRDFVLARRRGNTLRPDGAVSPRDDTSNLTDQSRIIHFLHLAYIVAGSALVAHLRDDFVSLCCFCQGACFMDTPRQRFLDVNVLTEL